MPREWVHKTAVGKAGGTWAWYCQHPWCSRTGQSARWHNTLIVALTHTLLGGRAGD